MKMIARCLLGVALAVPVCIATAVHAQDKPPDYPKKSVRIVIGIAPGGGLDSVTRLTAQKLSERWNQSVVVDNRPGGGSVIGMDIVAQALPDGYTLLGASDTLMLAGVLKRAAYDIRRAFIPIVRMTSQPYVLAVNPSLPVKSVKELIAYAKSKPGAMSYGSQGLGSNGHIGMERFKTMAGLDIVHVPYKGASLALIDLLSGQIQLTFASTVSTASYIKSGKLKGLAVTGPRRVQAYPELPTVSESGVPGFQLTNSYNFYAPAGTPRAIVRAINAIVIQGMHSPETTKVLAAEGTEAAEPASPEEFKAIFEREYADLEKLIKASNIKFN
jgi:tripartite-type tricarboxylate transporter receptor subunit TctC